MILIMIYNEKLVHQEAWYFKIHINTAVWFLPLKNEIFFLFILCVKTLTRYIASCAHTQTTSNTQTQKYSLFFALHKEKRCIVHFSHNILTHLWLIINFYSFLGQNKIVHVQSRYLRRCLKCNNKNCVFADCFENNYFVCIEVFIKI